MARERQASAPASTPAPAARGPRVRYSNVHDGRTRDEESESRGYPRNRIFKGTVSPQRILYIDKSYKEYNPKTYYVTTFRLLGQPDPDRPGRFLPPRVFNEAGRPVLTDFLSRYMTCRIAGRKGAPGTSFICWDPDQYPYENANDFKWRTPMFRVLGALKQAKKHNPDTMPRYWLRMLDKDDRQAFVKWPDWMYLAYGLLYQRGPGEVYDPPLGLDPRERPVLIDLGKHVGGQVADLLTLPTPEYAEALKQGTPPPGVAINDLYALPSPTAVKGGVLFHAFPLKTRDALAAERKVNPHLWTLSEEAMEGSFGYRVYATRTAVDAEHNKRTAKIEDHAEQLAGRIATPIHDQLEFLSFEEQAELIARHLVRPDTSTPCLDLLEHAWKDHDDWIHAIPQEVRDKAGRTKPGVGGGGGGRRRRDDDIDDDEDEAAERRRRRTTGRPSSTAATRPPADDEDDDDYDDEDDDLRGEPRGAGINDDEDDEDDDAVAGRVGHDHGDDDDEDDYDEEDDDDVQAATDLARQLTAGRDQAGGADDDDEDEDEDDQDDDPEDDEDDDLEDDEDEDEEDQPAAPPATAPSARRAAPVSRSGNGSGPGKSGKRGAGAASLEFEEPPAPTRVSAQGRKNLDALKAATQGKGKGPGKTAPAPAPAPSPANPTRSKRRTPRSA